MSAPSAPRNHSFRRQSDGTIRQAWSAPSNSGGEPINRYQIQIASNSAFSADRNTANTGSAVRTAIWTLTGFWEGKTVYARVRARNADGYGPWSSVDTIHVPGPPAAPTLDALTQVGDGQIRLDWTRGASPGLTLTDQYVEVASDPGFTSIFFSRRISGSATTYVARLGNRIGDVWARVRGRNAKGYSNWSNGRGITIVAPVGDLDGWAMNTIPAGVTPVVGEGLTRTTDGLALTFLTTSSITTGSKVFTIRRTPASPAVIGKKYRIAAEIRRNGSTFAGNATAGLSGSYGTVVNIDTSWRNVEFDWTATATSRYLDFRFIQTVPAGTGPGESILNVEMRNVRFVEVRETSPFRLGNTVYEGPLATHFDYACNTVGSAWFVDRNNIVQFRHYGDKAGFKAHFTDQPGIPDTLSYTDVSAAYDTRNTATAIRIQNHGRDATTGDAEDDDYLVQDNAAVAQWGRREAGVDMTLYQPQTYAASRGAEILTETAEPAQTITQIRFNIQGYMTLKAWTFDIQDRILVTFRGMTQPSRILGIHHDLTPTRWMVTLDLAKDA